MQHGASASSTFYNARILNGSAFVRCFALGIIADSGLGFINAVTVTTFVYTIVTLAWIGAQHTRGIIVWAIVYGILSGALRAIFSACSSLLAPTPAVISSWNGE
jgi:hypothetical protein